MQEFKKIITFASESGDGETITMSKELFIDSTWPDISEMFLRFLFSMGYHLKYEDLVEHLKEMLLINPSEDFSDTNSDYFGDEY